MIDDITLQESLEIIDDFLTEISESNNHILINDDVIYEKVQWKRNMNSLLRKYNYNANDGTIKYNGNTYKIKLGRDKDTSFSTKYDVNPSKHTKSGTTIIDSVINLNPDDFKYNSLNDMESTLLHEIGHHINYDTKTLDPQTIKSNIKSEQKHPDKLDQMHVLYNKFNNINNNQKDLMISNILKKKASGENLTPAESKFFERKGLSKTKLNKNGEGYVNRNKFAKSIENIADQKKDTQDYHANQREFDADRYAADHLQHGTNRVKNYVKNTYNIDIKEINDNAKNYVIKNKSEYSKYNHVKRLEDLKRRIEDRKNISWTIDNREFKNANDAITYVDNAIKKAKMNKDALKQMHYIKTSLNDSNSDLNKEISNEKQRRLNAMNSDIKSRRKALDIGSSIDTKSFTTINDKGTDKDRENRNQTLKNKASQGNMLAKQKKKTSIHY